MSETTRNENPVPLRFVLPDKGGESSKVSLGESSPIHDDSDNAKDQNDEEFPSIRPLAIYQGGLQGLPDNSPDTERGAPTSEDVKSSSVRSPIPSEAQPEPGVKSAQDGTKMSNDAFLEMLQVLFYEYFEIKSNSTSQYNTEEIQASMRKKLFGLTKGLSNPDTRSNARFDYEHKYPRDQEGKELEESARVWLTYLDEADVYDREKVEGWKETVDVLLVFAGLFSGVITTFVSQASQSLQQDYTQVSASLLLQMAQVQFAQFTGTPITVNPNSTLTPNSPFRPTTNAFLVNGLWFTSLAISLSTALIAVLTKQWLFYYMSTISGTAREKARVRHFRFQGLELWKVSLIIDLLPILLHLALGVFLIGVIIFLFPLDTRITWAIIAIAGITFTLYFISVMLPIRYPDCPYTTSLTIYIGNVFYFSSAIIHELGSKAKDKFRDKFQKRTLDWDGSVQERIAYRSRTFRTRILFFIWQHFQRPCSRIHGIFHEFVVTLGRIPGKLQDLIPTRSFTNWKEENVYRAIQKSAVSHDCKALRWLYTISSNPSVRRIIARGISGHPAPIRGIRPILYYLWLSLPREMDLAYLRINLCMDLQYGTTYYWGLLRYVSDADESQLDNVEYRSYSRISQSVCDNDYVQVLKDAFKDHTFKFPLAMWRCFFETASEDAILAAHILTSDEINPFDWCFDPARRSTYNTDIEPVGTREQWKWIFGYLSRCFCNGSVEPSLETRYRLLVSVYRNLTSDQTPTVEGINEEQKAESLGLIFEKFHSWLPPTDQYVSSKQFLAFHQDIVSVNAFWGKPMSDRARKYAMNCLSKLYWMAADRVSFFPFTECPDLSPIVRWCSQPRWHISDLMALVLMPQNHASLLRTLSGNPDAASQFANCLTNIRQRVDTWVEIGFIHPNLVDLFGSADPTLPLFDDSVLLQAWMLFVSNFNPGEFFRILKSKLNRQRLENLYGAILEETQSEQAGCLSIRTDETTELLFFGPEANREYHDKLRASLDDFRRITGLMPSNLESATENPVHRETAKTDDDTEACREPDDSQHTGSRSTANWKKKVFGFIRSEMSIT